VGQNPDPWTPVPGRRRSCELVTPTKVFRTLALSTHLIMAITVPTPYSPTHTPSRGLCRLSALIHVQLQSVCLHAQHTHHCHCETVVVA